VRLDSANTQLPRDDDPRAAAGYVCVLCGAVGSVLVPLILKRVSHDGLTGLLSGSFLPVLVFGRSSRGLVSLLGARSILPAGRRVWKAYASCAGPDG